MRFLLLALLLLGVGLTLPVEAETVCNSIDLEIMTTPALPQVRSSLTKFHNIVVPKQIDLAVLGDSLAEEIAASDLAQKVGAKTSFSLVGGGDGFQHGLYKLEKLEKKLSKSAPQKAVILLGTNNLGWGLCAIEAGFDKYLRQLKKIWPKTKFYLLPILPRGNSFDSNPNPDERYNIVPATHAFNDYLKQNAKAKGYIFLDINFQELTCGIYGSTDAATLSKNFYNLSQTVKKCGQLIGEGVDDEVVKIGLGASSTCKVNLALACRNYNADNLHLSDFGVSLLTTMIAKQIGSF
jgi:lysophospholipase L1-like esterase